MRIDPKNLLHCSLMSPSTLIPMVVDFVNEPESPEYKYFSSLINFAVTEFPYLSPIYDKYFSTTQNIEISDFEREFNEAVHDKDVSNSEDSDFVQNSDNKPALKFASKPLLKHILSFCYFRAVFDPKQLNKYKPFSAHVYGEMSFEAMDELLKVFGSMKNVRFIDLGSGVGQVVMQLAGSAQCDSCIGIEISDVPYGYSIEFAKYFRNTMEWFGKYYSPFQLIKADFTQPLYNPLILKSNFIFANNVMYGCELNNKLSAIFRDVPDGSQIFSSLPFIPKNFRLSRRTANEFGAVSRMHTINLHMEHMVSWTPKSIPLYQHIVDNKALLELVSNLNGKDILENVDLNQLTKPSKYIRKKVKSLSTKLHASPKTSYNGHRSELIVESQAQFSTVDTTVSALYDETIPETIKDESITMSQLANLSPIKESVTNSTLEIINNGIVPKVQNTITSKLSPLLLNGLSSNAIIDNSYIKETSPIISNHDSGLANKYKAQNSLTLLESTYSDDKEVSELEIDEDLSLKDIFTPVLPPDKDFSFTSPSINLKSVDLSIPGEPVKAFTDDISIIKESIVMPTRCQTGRQSPVLVSVPNIPTISEEPIINETSNVNATDVILTDIVHKIGEKRRATRLVESPKRKHTISRTNNKISKNLSGNGINGINGVHPPYTKPELMPIKNTSSSNIMTNVPNLGYDYKLVQLPKQSPTNKPIHKSTAQPKNSLNVSSQNLNNMKTMVEPIKIKPLNSKVSDIDSQLMQVIQNLDLAYANIILTVNEASKLNKSSPSGITGVAYKMYHQIHEQIDTFKEFTLNSLNEFIKPTYNTETFTTNSDLD